MNTSTKDDTTIRVLMTTAPENFEIGSTECEINGRREYLYDKTTLYRVRLFNRSYHGMLDAIARYRDGLSKGILSKMAF